MKRIIDKLMVGGIVFHKHSFQFSINIVLFCLKIIFIFTNSVDSDEMQHYAAFRLSLHCLQKY